MAEKKEKTTKKVEAKAVLTAPAFTSAFNLFKPSIEMVKLNLQAMSVLVFLPLVISALGTLSTKNPVYGVFTLAYILMLVAAPGAIIAQLKAADNKRIDAKPAFLAGLKFFWRFVGLILLMVLIFIVSLLLLIVPFFFALRRYILAPYYLIDQNLSPMEALNASAADSKRYSSPIWGFIGVQFLISLVNVIPVFGQAVSLAGAVTYVGAPALRYKQIQLAKKGKEPVTIIEEATCAPQS